MPAWLRGRSQSGIRSPRGENAAVSGLNQRRAVITLRRATLLETTAERTRLPDRASLTRWRCSALGVPPSVSATPAALISPTQLLDTRLDRCNVHMPALLR